MMKVFVFSGLMLGYPSWGLASVLLLLLISSSSLLSYHSQDWYCYASGMGWDSLAFALISLSVLISFLMMMAGALEDRWGVARGSLVLVMLLLMYSLMLVFSTLSAMMFYIFFEVSLLPTFFLVLGWGSQPERSQAGVYMILYTVLASLPLLVSLMYWGSFSGSNYFAFLVSPKSGLTLSGVWSGACFFAFLVKLPLFAVHLWLPKAHVQAPVFGSMVLAAVLLKLGGYGLMRILSKGGNLLLSVGPLLMTWAIVGGVYMAITCVVQNDLKTLIALSSVAHMALVVGSLAPLNIWGFSSAGVVMISHGFCSSGLFFIVNFNYERLGSRSATLLKGLLVFFPTLAFWWFVLALANMGVPPSLNFLGEVTAVVAMSSWSFFLMAGLAFMVFLSAVYSLYLYSQTQHGVFYSASLAFQGPSVRELLVLTWHSLPLGLGILSPWLLQFSFY